MAVYWNGSEPIISLNLIKNLRDAGIAMLAMRGMGAVAGKTLLKVVNKLNYLNRFFDLFQSFVTRESVMNWYFNSLGDYYYEKDGRLYWNGPLADIVQEELDNRINNLPTRDDLCSCMNSPEEPCPSTPPETVGSPIILDLNNDGVKTIDLENGVYFDHDGNRFAGKSGWVSPEDALIVRDINGNGRIDGGGELFGNNTELSNGGKAANGFAALAEFDSNGDGVVDKNDERWTELKLWQDKYGNGKTDDGELPTLEEAGFSGLNIAYVNQNYTDENGNEHRQTGTFVRDDGSTGGLNDVNGSRSSGNTHLTALKAIWKFGLCVKN